MERTGSTSPGVSAPELAEVASREGPFLSLYLTTEKDVDHAAQTSVRRWGSMRRGLANDGAPQRCLSAIDDLVPDAHLEGSVLAAVAGATGSLWVDHDEGPLVSDIGRWGAAPTLTPALAWRQQQPPHVVALVDRRGADLLAVCRDRPPEAVRAGAGEWRISKTRGGGWAHWTLQHRVEEAWARNARESGARITDLVDAIGARVVVVAGNSHEIAILRDSLPERVDRLVEVVPGSRAVEAGSDHNGDEVTRLVHTVAARDTVATLEALHAREHSAGTAVEGAEGTLAALREARVDVLVVHDPTIAAGRPGRDGLDGAAGSTGAPGCVEAWFDPGAPAMCAATPDGLRALGVATPRRGRLVDVAVRAALVSGATVRVVPAHGGPAGGLGALLRWSE